MTYDQVRHHARTSVLDLWNKYTAGYPFPDHADLVTVPQLRPIVPPALPSAPVLHDYVMYNTKGVPSSLKLAFRISVAEVNEMEENLAEVCNPTATDTLVLTYIAATGSGQSTL